MANTEHVVVLGVKTGDAIQNVADLKNNIKLLKEALNDETMTMEQNKDVLDQLRQNQNELKDAMYQSAKSTDELIAESKTLNGSYNELVHTMAELKMRWREVTDETERADLGARIKEINDTLKDMDASVGNFQRNVGDYQNSFENAMKYSLDLTKGLGGSIGNLSSQMLKLMPVIKTVTKTATAGLKGVKAALASTGIGALVVVLGTLISKLTEFIQKKREATDTTEAFEKAQENARKVIEQNNKELQRQITLMRSNGATSVDTAKAELDNAQSVVDKQKELISIREQEMELTRKNRMYKEDARKELMANQKAEIDGLKEVLKTMEDTLKDKQVAYQAAINNQLRAINDATKAALQSVTQALKAEYDADIAFMKEHNATQEDIEKRTQRYYKELKELNDKANKDAITDAKDAEKRAEEANKFYMDWANRMLAAERARYELGVELTKGTKDELQARIELAKYDLSALYQKEGESAEEYAVRVAKATNALKELYQQQADNAYEEEHLVFENKINALMEGSNEYLQAELELRAFELASLHQLEEESDEEFRARQLAADKAYRQAKDALLMGQIASMQRYAGAVSGIMGSIADILESGTQDDLKAAERAKSIRIASATIDTISGAVGAFMQAVKSVPAPYGAILGAAEAAAVTASGVAQIAKIKATKITANATTSSPSAMSASVSAPTIEQAVPQTALVTSASDEEKLNQIGDQKVYILSSDLEANSRRVQIQEGESSF
jgi:hypothetical protein